MAKGDDFSSPVFNTFVQLIAHLCDVLCNALHIRFAGFAKRGKTEVGKHFPIYNWLTFSTMCKETVHDTCMVTYGSISY